MWHSSPLGTARAAPRLRGSPANTWFQAGWGLNIIVGLGAAAGILVFAIAIWRLAHPATVLVPGHPAALRIVYYAPGPATPANPDATHPVKVVSISNGSRVRSIARELNGLAAVPTGVATTCAVDYGTHDALTFIYIDGSTRTADLQTSGCLIASEDGAVSRWPRGLNANFAMYREIRRLECPTQSQVYWLMPCSGPQGR